MPTSALKYFWWHSYFNWNNVLCTIESATRQVLLCDRKIVIHVQSFIVSRIHQRYSFLQKTEAMSAFWRAAGLTYVNYSSIAAKVTRQALKAGPVKVSRHPWFHHDVHLLVRLFVTKSQPSTISFHWLVLKSQEAATKREITSVKFQKWDSGKPVGSKFWAWGSECLGCSLG